MKYGTWNVRSLYRAGSLTAAARELVSYKLDLVGVQEVMCDREGMVRAGIIIFSMEMTVFMRNNSRSSVIFLSTT